ncbi:MAG: nucleotidyltransferase family protein [Chlorobi bacterium]|nr:nucleotidyltransferase family protein [Chlorobiota bacterium]MCI0715903.1 nucleotidyltransferase family protein [Chlorobiota bacterium]
MSNLSDIISKIKKAKPSLATKYKVSKIGVFGSYVKNEQRPESDVDIMVEFSEPIGLDFVMLAEELENILNEKVDLVSRKAIKPKYLTYVEKELHYV